jgi:hypothetical protein
MMHGQQNIKSIRDVMYANIVSFHQISPTSHLPSIIAIKQKLKKRFATRHVVILYRVILSVLDPRKCEYLKDYSLDFEHAYMTTYLAS